jgi:hypothetical protein
VLNVLNERAISRVPRGQRVSSVTDYAVVASGFRSGDDTNDRRSTGALPRLRGRDEWWGEAPELHQVFAERIAAFNSKRATLQRCRAVVYGLPRPWSLARQGTGSAAFQLVSRRGIESSATLITAFGLSGASPHHCSRPRKRDSAPGCRNKKTGRRPCLRPVQ